VLKPHTNLSTSNSHSFEALLYVGAFIKSDFMFQIYLAKKP
jgi:hypothetical protein